MQKQGKGKVRKLQNLYYPITVHIYKTDIIECTENLLANFLMKTFPRQIGEYRLSINRPGSACGGFKLRQRDKTFLLAKLSQTENFQLLK